MVAYRFCRPDDIPLLIGAVNDCYNFYFPENQPLTLAGFQSEVRELNAWPSNCMIATAGQECVGVSIATKRPDEVRILRIAIRQDFQRAGHGRHLLTSLSQKLAVLGPPHLSAEVPSAWRGRCSFFEACGYRAESVLRDYRLSRPLPAPESGAALIPISVQDLDDADLLDDPDGIAWERSSGTLLNRREQIEGVAVASPDRIEAFVLYRPIDPGREIVRIGGCRGEYYDIFVQMLLRSCCSGDSGPATIPRLSAGESRFETIEALGFSRDSEYIRYVAQARAL